jgi:hypothetical protein
VEAIRAAVAATSSRHAVSAATSPALSSEASAELRKQLETELAGVADEELTTWAARNLRIKSSLTPDDARAIERGFELRLAALARTELDDTEEAAPSAATEHVPARPETVLAIPKTPRRRDKRHLRFVCTQPCLVCGRTPSDAHHLRFAEPRALGRKVSDEFTVPLCRSHHRELHDAGDERRWWTEFKVDPAPIAQLLWSQTR